MNAAGSSIPGLIIFIPWLLIILLLLSCSKNPTTISESFQITDIRVGNVHLSLNAANNDCPTDSSIFIEFNVGLDKNTIPQGIFLLREDNSLVSGYLITYNGNNRVALTPVVPFARSATYKIRVTSSLKGMNGETIEDVEYSFKTVSDNMKISSISLNGKDFTSSLPLRDISFTDMNLEIRFTQPLNSSDYESFFTFSPGINSNFTLSDSAKHVTIKNSSPLSYYTHYTFTISKNLVSANGHPFDGFTNSFYTALDSTPKFPVVSDNELLTLIQQTTFKYFYHFAHPACGLARERNNSGDIVTIGGSGFGVMALIVGMERGFITRQEGLDRVNKILGFLETCDRFHGAWPHWLNGSTGKTIAFTTLDDGADLVETSYMVEGLYTMHQYLDPAVPAEKQLIDRIDALTDAVEYDWFTRGQNVLYWHWSPDHDWAMNMQIRGYNETLITYIVAATSVLHPISAAVYHEGYARNGAIQNGNQYYGYTLPLGEPYGGPLFFTHYSFLGLDPRNLRDAYAWYWEQNANQSLINQAYCDDNPRNWVGYSDQCWGLTASDTPWGYGAQSPTNDPGVITPTAAVSALPYVPEQSMKAIRHFYYMLGDRLWGQYGFYDAFDVTEGWWAGSFLGIDEGPIICMIENYRSQLLWNLFMSHPKVKPGLDKLGFSY